MFFSEFQINLYFGLSICSTDNDVSESVATSFLLSKMIAWFCRFIEVFLKSVSSWRMKTENISSMIAPSTTRRVCSGIMNNALSSGSLNPHIQYNQSKINLLLLDFLRGSVKNHSVALVFKALVHFNTCYWIWSRLGLTNFQVCVRVKLETKWTDAYVHT